MIYLFDDNKYGQMSQNYKVNFENALKKYKTILIWKEEIVLNEIEFLISQANCILIHDSMDPKEDKEFLVALAKKNNIPYCLFSNGFTATQFNENSIVKIKKDRFYNNLLSFLDHYKVNGELKLDFLSLGEKYDIEKASILQDKLSNGVLFRYMDTFEYEVVFFGGSTEYKDLQELAYLSDPVADFAEMDDAFCSNRPTASELRLEILKMVKKVKERYE